MRFWGGIKLKLPKNEHKNTILGSYNFVLSEKDYLVIILLQSN